jgi:hypothetical protein
MKCIGTHVNHRCLSRAHNCAQNFGWAKIESLLNFNRLIKREKIAKY